MKYRIDYIPNFRVLDEDDNIVNEGFDTYVSALAYILAIVPDEEELQPRWFNGTTNQEGEVYGE